MDPTWNDLVTRAACARAGSQAVRKEYARVAALAVVTHTRPRLRHEPSPLNTRFPPSPTSSPPVQADG